MPDRNDSLIMGSFQNFDYNNAGQHQNILSDSSK